MDASEQPVRLLHGHVNSLPDNTDYLPVTGLKDLLALSAYNNTAIQVERMRNSARQSAGMPAEI